MMTPTIHCRQSLSLTVTLTPTLTLTLTMKNMIERPNKCYIIKNDLTRGYQI